MKKWFFVLAAGAFVFLAAQPSAQVADDLRYVVTPSQPLTYHPKGPKKGDIYINTPVKVLKRDGEWVKVLLSGWMREKSLSTKKDMRSDYLLMLGDRLLEVVSYSTKLVEKKEGVSKPRVYLTLKLKNNSRNTVFSWSGLLVAQNKVSGKVIFREPIQADSSKIAPGKTASVSFYWHKEEPPDNALLPEGLKGLMLKLYKVKLNK